MSDDVLAFDPRAERSPLQAVPSYPFLKAWPDALRSFDRQPEAYPAIFPGAEKRRVSVEAEFLAEPAPLHTLYILDRGHRVAVDPVGPVEGFAEIVRHTYMARALEDCGPQPWHFELASELTRSTRLRRLVSPVGPPDGIDSVLGAVIRDLGMES
jgi:hypothetical protein